MNVLFLLCDTFTRDKLEPYHRAGGRYDHIRTPNLTRFAERAVCFDNHWLNSAPCMPARRDLFSGRIEFPWRSWGPRESFDPDWSVSLRDSAVETALFTDHANLFDVGAGNYHHFFDTYHFVRGHVNDHLALDAPVEPGRPGLMRELYLSARRHEEDPDKSFVARNLGNVEGWLDAHAESKQPFFLLVDEFDPHWPLDPPEPYRSMYVENPELLEKDLGGFYRGGSAEAYSDEELEWLNAQYAGKVTMVDHYLGRLFDCLDRNRLWDDTMVVLTTDHGEFIGEYGQVSKGHGPSYPLFARIPLLIHYPGSPLHGNRWSEPTCAVDLHATVLEALGQNVDPACHGASLLPILRGGPGSRAEVIYGWWGKGFYWTDGNTLVCKAPAHPGPLYQYGTNLGEKYVGLSGSYFDRYAGAEVGPFMPHTNRPVYRVPSNGMAYSAADADRDMFFDLDRDPDCGENLWNTAPERRNRALEKLRHAMRHLAVPDEHFQRLGLDRGGESA